MTFSKCSSLQIDITCKIVELLGQRNIAHSSVDLVRFRWVEDNEVARNATVVTTPVPIWVGVVPGTLSSEDTFDSSNDILDLLKDHDVSDIDIAYRESIAMASSGGPEPFAPVPDLDTLKAIVHPTTTALGLPIAGLETLETQGTMGFYFTVGKDLYALTARHVLFPEGWGNFPCVHVGMFPSR